MPQIIQYIDAIARHRQRDVLYLVFGARTVREYMREESTDDDADGDVFDTLDEWERTPNRQLVLDWLDEQGMAWQPCGGFANVNVMPPYMGFVYVDVPYDTALPEYQKLEAFLEQADGSRVFPDVLFCYVPLAMAMNNAKHDDPDFWARWAEEN
ncbi:MAG: hypothetical protein KA389_00880 [Hydromonas sp.]|nr:hypothetical protein [Hydromonas sp.]